MARTIKLTQGKFTIVDNEDFDFLNQFHWHITKQGYAARNKYVRGSGRKNQKTIVTLMHRLILNANIGDIGDHINQNKLDNRHSNLRLVNKSINAFNSKIRTDNTSGYRGIWWHRKNCKWIVEFTINQKKKRMGCFKELKDVVKVSEDFLCNLKLLGLA